MLFERVSLTLDNIAQDAEEADREIKNLPPISENFPEGQDVPTKQSLQIATGADVCLPRQISNGAL
jgi:hypothetical protein